MRCDVTRRDETSFFHNSLAQTFVDTFVHCVAYSLPTRSAIHPLTIYSRNNICNSLEFVQGACTVDCGGARKIVADTGLVKGWFADGDGYVPSYEARRFMEMWIGVWGGQDAIDEYWSMHWSERPWRPDWWLHHCVDVFCGENALNLDVKVIVLETSDSEDGFEAFTGFLASSFTYLHPLNPLSPWIDEIEPRYGSSNDVFRITGTNLGTSLKDYRNVYFGPGRPPVGGNLESEANSALCRPEDLNAAANPEGEVFGTFQAVTVDQQTSDPIALTYTMHTVSTTSPASLAFMDCTLLPCLRLSYCS